MSSNGPPPDKEPDADRPTSPPPPRTYREKWDIKEAKRKDSDGNDLLGFVITLGLFLD